MPGKTAMPAESLSPDAAEIRRMVRQNLRPLEDFVPALRAYNTHPVTLYTYLLPLTMLVTDIMKPEYPDISPAVSHALTTAKVAAFWALDRKSVV